jgi:hypothetical protein
MGEEFSDKRRDGYDVAAILARADAGWPMTSRRPTVP